MRTAIFSVAAVLVAAVTCVPGVAALARHNHYARLIKQAVREHQTASLLANPDVTLPAAQFHTQALDHFDATNTGTYQQRFFVNDTFFKPATGPVFLYIGGEGALSPRDVVEGHMCELAEKVGALMVGVEHRYYGASVPVPNLENANMRFLSSQQALADLATFHTFFTGKMGLTSSNPWVCFGGSYPGALSAFFRIKYPQVVIGAVASSAPVEARLNFEGYHHVIDASLQADVVGGSVECTTRIKSAFGTVASCLANQTERAAIGTSFNSCGSIAADNDAETLIANLANIFDGVVQYNNIIPGLNVEKVCEIMTNTTQDDVTNLRTLNAVFMQQNGQKCMDNSYANSIAPILNTTADPTSMGVGDRQWYYQTCTQFAYYQTCDANTTCPYVGVEQLDLDAQTALCKTAFGIDPASIQGRVDFENAYYGGNKPSGSNICFVNGSIDPWHWLSVLTGVGNTIESIFIDGTAHCANMEPTLPSDPKPLTAARAEIDTVVMKWLADHAAQQ